MLGPIRIIKMLNIVDDKIVVEEKGIYRHRKLPECPPADVLAGIYLHKTSVSAEKMLISIIERVKALVQAGEKVFASPALLYFLENNIIKADFENKRSPARKIWHAGRL